MPTVFILRRDPLVARRTQAVLEAAPGWTVAGMAHSLFRARAQLALSDADVLLTDLSLEDGAALSLVHEMRSTLSSAERPKVLAISPSTGDGLLFATLSAGADSFMVDGPQSPSVTAVLSRLMRGEAAMTAPLARQVLAFFGALVAIGMAAPANERELDWVLGARDPLRLSEGERYMLVLLAQGEPLGGLAVRMGLSVEHVGRRIANVYRKLQWDVRTGSLALSAA